MIGKRLQQLRGDIAGMASEAREAIGEIRDRIEDLKLERRTIEHTPDDFETIQARIDDVISQAASQAGFFSPTGIGNGDAIDIAGLFDRKFVARPFVALAVIAPEKLRELITAGVPTDGMRPDQKAVKLDDVKRQLLAAEVAEELACREMDDFSGGHFPRRLDADPAVLLAPTADLQ